jgi:hypothetical protein
MSYAYYCLYDRIWTAGFARIALHRGTFARGGSEGVVLFANMSATYRQPIDVVQRKIEYQYLSKSIIASFRFS